MVFAKGDLVWLSSRNIRSTRPCKKLDYKFYGLFEIEELVGKQSYRLRLTKGMGKVHPVFNVSLLEPHRTRPREDLPPLESIVVDRDEQWKVEEVLSSRTHYGKLQYLVR